MQRLVPLLLALGSIACSGGSAPAPADDPAALKADVGVDVSAKKIRVGALNDESGPGAVIGKPFADGKRLLAAVINQGGTGALPEGWTIELVERDHGYNPSNAVAGLNEIKGEVLFVGTSFGTPNTLPLLPLLEQDSIVAFPASLSSEMAANVNTPPLGPSYKAEAIRAVDWVAETAPGAKLGIVYQKDDYGQDGVVGLEEGAKAHGLEIVAKESVAPGQKDFAASVVSLKEKGATHVLLTVLPSATGPVLGTAAQLGYMPTWIGNTPAWIDRFYNPEVIPPVVFTNYYQIGGLPFWGEPVPGMAEFEAAWETHGAKLGGKDSYVLLSYIQGRVQVEAARRAIEGGDITRSGYLAALRSIEGWTADGMVQAIDLKTFPYVVGTRTRVLKPDFATGSWTVVSDYAEAGSVHGAAAGAE